MIPVVFKSYSDKRSPRLHGDQVMLDHIFIINKQFSFDLVADGAIVCFNAVENHENIDKLTDDLAGYKWVLLIVTANEDGSNEWQNIKHPNMKLWLQTPSPENKADRFIGLGYPSVLTKPDLPKKYAWFFSGQVNHQRREDCVATLKKLPNGKLNCTEGFNQGYDHKEYVEYMAQAKFVPCPGGPATPDTFRVYEALELGAIPILDRNYSDKQYQGDYWNKVLGNHPLPIVENWSQLEDNMGHLLQVYDLMVEPIQEWWGGYKKQVLDNLLADVKELRGKI